MKIIDLSKHYAIIKVSGANAENFLQGQLTLDIRDVKDQNIKLAAFCNLKGRVRAIFRIFKHNHDFYLILPLTLASSVIEDLKKYAKFSKVNLTLDNNETFSHYGIIDDSLLSIKTFLESFQSKPLETFLSKTDEEQNDMAPFQYTTKEEQNNPAIYCFTLPHSNKHCLELIAPKNISSNFLQTKIKDSVDDFNDWEVAEIEALIPEIYPETKELFLPHHINLPKLGAISFTKGCYTGQEIIARMQYKANIKKEARYLLIPSSVKNEKLNNTIPKPGDKITIDDNDNALVIRSTTNQNNDIILLLECLI